MRQAILKKGVSVIVLPGDVALRPAPEDANPVWHTPLLPRVLPPESELEAFKNILESGKKITLLMAAAFYTHYFTAFCVIAHWLYLLLCGPTTCYSGCCSERRYPEGVRRLSCPCANGCRSRWSV